MIGRFRPRNCHDSWPAGNFNSRRTPTPVLERRAIGHSLAPKSGIKTPIDRFEGCLAPQIPFPRDAVSLQRIPSCRSLGRHPEN